VAAALHDLVRLGDARAVAAALDALESQDGLLAAQREHARAAAAGDAVALEAVVDAFAGLGVHLVAAEACRELADLLRRRGAQRAARAADRRLDALLAACPGASTPGLRTATAVVPLSAREREVAALAAGGLANRDIASTLVLSVRTVENHLRAVYDKLGVSGREELAEVFGPAARG
jgi:ATP/maltotriose-dependent transcriptional regulator MalT